VATARKNTRSTQSFVGVMGRVWKRPALTLTELGWRWLAGGPLLLCVLLWARAHQLPLAEMWASLGTMTFFHPAQMAFTLGEVSRQLFALARPVLGGFVPLAMLWWVVLGAFGQAIFARRWDHSHRPNRAALFALRLLRSLGVLLCWVLWAGIVLAVAHRTLNTTATLGAEPNVLLFLAMLIVLSLALFVGWAGLGSPLLLAAAEAARTGASLGNSLRFALRNRVARAEVLEISLVMCIVKLALLVLALTFSACPLPFSSVETAEFLRNWWIGVGVLYLFMSDYFHSVRFAAFLQLAAAAETQNRI